MGSDSSHSRIRELNHSALGGLAISEVPGLPFTGYRRFLDRGDGHHVLLLPTSLAVANSGDDGGTGNSKALAHKDENQHG